MLLAYLSDRIATNSVQQLHPKTDNCVLAKERLHITPQTIGGLHADPCSLDFNRVPVQTLQEEDVRRVNNYRADFITPTAPSEAVNETMIYKLGPPGGQSHQWPACMFKGDQPGTCKISSVQNVKHTMKTHKEDNDEHIHVETTQKETPYEFLEPAPRDDVQPTIQLKPYLDLTFKEPLYIWVGNIYRVEVAKIDQTKDPAIKEAALQKLMTMRERHTTTTIEDNKTLLRLGLESINDIVPEWKDVIIKDPEDSGPPQRTTNRQLALQDRPRNPDAIPIIPTIAPPPTIAPTPEEPIITFSARPTTARAPNHPPVNPELPPQRRYIAQPPYLHPGQQTNPQINISPWTTSTHTSFSSHKAGRHT